MSTVIDKGIHRPVDSFPFTATSTLPTHVSFDNPDTSQHIQARGFKRRRPLWDVDGGCVTRAKKRRLRLNFFTSRLSQPFSVPAMNIVNRGVSKIAIWAKGRRLDKNDLRKAAIMNRVRLGFGSGRQMIRRREPNNQAHPRQQMAVPTPSPRPLPLPSSPLGISNYDALDLEDDRVYEQEHNSPPKIYSDFNIMDPDRIAGGDKYEYLDELDDIAQKFQEVKLPSPDDRLLEIMKEKERQKEISFVRFMA